MLETAKLQKLERQAHQWVQQEILSLDKFDIIYPQIKRLMKIVEEKDQFLGPDMEMIADLSIQEKMLTLSSLTTLTIDIQNYCKVGQNSNIGSQWQHMQLWKSVYRKDQLSDFTSHESQT